MSMLRTTKLTHQYGRRRGIRDVDIEVGPGEIFGFLGPNGAGKSTTIRLLMGFLQPHQGRAEIAGLDCWRQSARVKQQVGYLPGDLRLYPWLTLQSGAKLVSRVRGTDIRPRAAELAKRFELEPNLASGKMSRGTRQKLGLVLAMAHRPKLLILDEPTSGLDPLMQAELAMLLREAAAEGCTVFFSSHTLSEVDSLCDRVAIIRQGSLVADDSLATLRAQAPRIVELTYDRGTDVQSVELPPLLKRLETRGHTLVCELNGPAPPLVEWASHQGLSDIGIGPPDLERLFHSLYHAEEESP